MFKEITREKMAAWDGPVNYISVVEAFKEGPHSMTPLRICMNSSLKQPQPVSLSLNDCLVKGLSALVELFTVTLCIREHRYALTKDLSKFYQRVDADPIAQNLPGLPDGRGHGRITQNRQYKNISGCGKLPQKRP